MAEAPTTLLELGQDCLIRVLTFCSVHDVLALGCACKQLAEALMVGAEGGAQAWLPAPTRAHPLTVLLWPAPSL